MRQRIAQAIDVVELDDPRELREIRDLTQQARPMDGTPIDESHVRFIDRAVVAAIEDQDLRPSRHGSGHAQREAIRIRRRRRDLPVRQAEALGQQVPHRDRVSGGQHVRQALAGLSHDRVDDRLRRMPEHGAGVAEAEVGVVVAVDVVQRRALRRFDQERKRHRPVAHPVHGHAVVETGDAAAGALLRSGVCVDVAPFLGSKELADPLQRHATKKSRCHVGEPLGPAGPTV